MIINFKQFKKIFLQYFSAIFAVLITLVSLGQYFEFGRFDPSFSLPFTIGLSLLGGTIGAVFVSSIRKTEKDIEKYQRPNEAETTGVFKFIFGAESLKFSSPYPPELASSKLRQQITETPFLFFPVCEDSLIGKVKEKDVKLQWARQGRRNSFNPIFKGEFKSTPSGSELIGTFRMSRFISLLSCVWFGGLAAASLIATSVIFMDKGLKTFQSAAGIFLLVYVGFAVLLGASGIGLIAFGKRIARASLFKMTEVIKKSIE
ncbi:MAG: hypothetical protein M0Z60_12315 [Nitrospiraceae bacterium]|nr:hypothetical protein [Nitrospiraceae bacterium]